MKLIRCKECHDIYVPDEFKMKKCRCKKSAAKYLDDNLTTISTSNTYVFGIDNQSFGNADVQVKHWCKEHPDTQRRDFYFVGWFPSKPDEVIWVDTIKEVKNFPMDHVPENFNPNGTRPTTGDD